MGDDGPKVIQRLLDNSEAYGIFKIPDPEAEEPEEEEEVVAIEDAEESTQVGEEATADSDEGETAGDQ